MLGDQRHQHGLAADEQRPARVHRVAGVRRERDVTGIEEREVEVEDALLGADRRHHLGIGVEAHVEPAGVERGDGLAKLRASAVASGTCACSGRPPPAAQPRRSAGTSGVSGSPIPRLITSTPAARLAATLRSSSANRYGGIRSRRLLGRMQLLYEVVGQAAARTRALPSRSRLCRGPPPPRPRASPPSSTTVTGERPPASTCATAAPVAPVPLAEVSPTPRSKIRARIVWGSRTANHDTFVRLGNSSWRLERRADRRQVKRGQLLLVVDRDRALRVADLDVLKAPGSAVRGQLPAPVRGPRRVVVALQTRAAHVDRALGRRR